MKRGLLTVFILPSLCLPLLSRHGDDCKNDY